MWTHRIVYLLAVTAALGFYIIYALPFSWFLLVLALLFPVFDIAFSLPGMLAREVSLTAPKTLEQGTSASVAITTLATRRAPSGWIRAGVRREINGKRSRRKVLVPGERGSLAQFPIDTRHSGFCSFELKRVWVTSIMGLFALPRAMGKRATTLILPAPVKAPLTAALPWLTILRPKPGGGYSEEHDIRPYRLGDPLNSIHWKLTAKHDELIVREPLEPPPHSRLVDCSEWKTPDERDLILGRLRWISDYLLEHDCPHYVRLGEGGPIAEITEQGELAEYLRHALDPAAPPMPAPPGLPARFSWIFLVDTRGADA